MTDKELIEVLKYALELKNKHIEQLENQIRELTYALERIMEEVPIYDYT